MPHITFSEKLAASARFAYIQCEGLYYHYFMLSVFIYFARYVLLFASGSCSPCIDGGLLRFSYRRPCQLLLLCL
jgi:hypothetical protein